MNLNKQKLKIPRTHYSYVRPLNTRLQYQMNLKRAVENSRKKSESKFRELGGFCTAQSLFGRTRIRKNTKDLRALVLSNPQQIARGSSYTYAYVVSAAA